MKTNSLDSALLSQPFKGLNIHKLIEEDTYEVLAISLEKGTTFPSHESKTDAHLILLEGAITFYLENEPINVLPQQKLSFPKNTEHWVKALENAKFLIIRQ